MAVDQRFADLLAHLLGHRVDLVVVGGVAAVLAGAPISTFDLDVVVEPGDANLARLTVALAEIDARYLDLAGRTIRPSAELLRQNRMNLLETRLGRLDVAREIGAGRAWAELRERSSPLALGPLTCLVLDLAAVIETKVEADRAKDRAVLPVLRETLRLANLRRPDPAD